MRSMGRTQPIKQAGAEELPLPPHPPDYTTIDEIWSKAEQFLRRVVARRERVSVRP